MTMRLLLRCTAMVMLLAGCIDFVEPTSLGLETPARYRLFIALRTPAAACGSEPAPFNPATTGICIDLRVDLGTDLFGEQRPLVSDTLWVQNQPYLPNETLTSELAYQVGLRLPAEAVPVTALDIRFPVLGGISVPSPLRWYAAGRPAEDSVVTLRPDGDLLLRVIPPGAASFPEPSSQNWSVDVRGPNALFTVRGQGTPWPEVLIPDTLLAQLGAPPVAAILSYTQILAPPAAGNLILYVELNEIIAWSVVPAAAG